MSQQHNLELKPVSSQEIDLLLELMAGFNQEEAIEFDPIAYRQRITAALNTPQLVRIWLIVAGSNPAGYAVLTFTFSFEFGGTHAMIDEIYITPEARGQGLGTSVLQRLAEKAADLGVAAMGADVSDEKPWLSSFYQRAGFEAHPYRPYYKKL